MKIFDELEACVKCGSFAKSVQCVMINITETPVRKNIPQVISPREEEYLAVTCLRCGASCRRACLDAKPESNTQ